VIVNVSVISAMTAYSDLLCVCVHTQIGICRHSTDDAHIDKHSGTVLVILAGHWFWAPWWWFLREPKHVGAAFTYL